jgi:hypothetical protein
MNIRLGIYEVFSRIVPGGLYLVVIVQILSTLGIVHFDWQVVNNLSLAALIGLIVVAYILGGAFDNLAMVPFHLFKRRNVSARRLAQFKETYGGRWRFDFEDGDWPLLLAFIRIKSLELAGELDRHNALSIMLRNVSLGFLFLAINSFIQFFIFRNSMSIFIALVILGLSMLILREAMKFRAWFYDGIYHTILAYRIDLAAVIKPVRSGGKRNKVEKG